MENSNCFKLIAWQQVKQMFDITQVRIALKYLSKQRMIDPIINYVKGGKLIITSMCVTPDFPATFKYAEPEKSWTNCIWKFDLYE